MFVKEDRETGKVVQKPCLFKAKFHYTDPTRTRHGPDPTRTKSAHTVGDELNSTTRTRTRTRHGPDTDKVRARCRVRAKFHYTDPTRTRPDPHGSARTFFAAKLRWVRAGRRQSPRGSGRVRVVEFSFNALTPLIRYIVD